MPSHITNKQDIMEYFSRVDVTEARIVLESIGWLLKGRGVALGVGVDTAKPKRERKPKPKPNDSQQSLVEKP